MENKLKTTFSTVRELETLKPGDAPYEARDAGRGSEPWLYCCVLPSGRKSFVFRYRFKGASKKLTLGAIGLAEARQRAREARNLRDAGTDPAAQKAAAKVQARQVQEQTREAERQAEEMVLLKVPEDLVETVVGKFIEMQCAQLRTRGEIERALEREVVSRWKGRRLSEISGADVHALLDDLVARGAPVQANRVLGYLKRLCKWSKSRGTIAINPCEDIDRPAKERSRDRVLDDDELRLVWRGAETLGWPFAPVVQLLTLTGQRRNEIADGRWAEVDLDAKTWTLPFERVKNGRRHIVPLSPQAMAIIKAMPRVGADGFMFTTTGASSVSGFSRAKANLDAAITELNYGRPLPDWTLHDLRRTVASGLARLGVDLAVIERCLNHISGSFGGIVGVYQRHKFEPEMRRALELWGAHVECLVADEAEAKIVEFKR